MRMFLRSLKTGDIMPNDPRIAVNGGVELVTEAEAFPERFAPVPLKGRKRKIDISIPKETVEAPQYTSPELEAEASALFGGPRASAYSGGS